MKISDCPVYWSGPIVYKLQLAYLCYPIDTLKTSGSSIPICFDTSIVIAVFHCPFCHLIGLFI